MTLGAEAAGQLPLRLKAKGLGYHMADRWLFRDLSFEVRETDFIAILGPSGVGKTTLLKCLSGLLQPHEGTVEIHLPPPLAGASGQVLEAASPCAVRPQLGLIFQQLHLIRNSSLLTNVLSGRVGRYPFWRTLFGFPRTLHRQAWSLLEDLGIGAFPHKPVSALSGGEQQRVAVARALFQEPALFFADEPVSNLDAYYAGRVLGNLRQQASERRRPVLCILHNSEHIQRFADHALSLSPTEAAGWRWRPVRTAPKASA